MNMDWETKVSSEIADTEDWLKTSSFMIYSLWDFQYELVSSSLNCFVFCCFPKHGKGKVKRRPQKKVDALSKDESVSRQHKMPPQLEESNVSVYHQ